MRERIGRFSHWLWHQLSVFFTRLGRLARKGDPPAENRLPTIIWKPFLFLTTPLRVLVLWGWRAVTAVWRFGGRLGLAIRNLGLWLIWEPLVYATAPLRRAGSWLWRAAGRLGLALRSWLLRFFWRPLTAVISWIFRRVLQPLLLPAWQASAPRRRLYQRRLRSRWLLFRARLRLVLKRPSPPDLAITAPKLPRKRLSEKRSIRLTTALVTVSAILTFGWFNLQPPQPEPAVAEGPVTPIVIVVTPTPSPVTAVPTTEPTPEIILTPWPTPDPLNGGGSLAFDYHLEGNSDIYLLPVGQSDLVRLTSDPAVDREPAWNPSGHEIAFSSRRGGQWDIYIYNFSRGELRNITDDLAFDGNPSWSSDGLWLVYESYQQDNLDIYIVKGDLSEGPYRLTQHPSLDFAPVWSPGGRHVAFTSWRSGNKDIFLLSLDEASDLAAVNITNSPDTPEDDPAFSPDGQHLSYYAEHGPLRMLYDIPLAADYTLAGPPVSLGQQGRHPTWSPDSQSLVFTHQQGDSYYLVASKPDAWGVAPQTFAGQGALSHPSWSGINLSRELVHDLSSIDPVEDTNPLFVEAIATPEADQPPAMLFELPVSAPSAYLSDEVDQSFLALQERVKQEAGWDLLGRLDGMFEPISSRPLPGLDAESWNKAGRAFDLYYREAMAFEPRLEVVRQETSTGTYWRIYVRTAVQDGSLGEPLRELPWDFQSRYGSEPQYYDQGGKLKEAIPAGYYVDFTALAADYGWQWTAASDSWRTFFPAIRFWHYENRGDLSWESAMLQIYTPEELQQLP